MQLTTTVICPYCGHESGYCAKDERGYALRYCDSESGGCNGMFLIEHKAHITATTRRIEGEEKHATERECRCCPLQPTKPKLTEDEENFVRWAIEFGFKWAAREPEDILHLGNAKPKKLSLVWGFGEGKNIAKVNTDKYPFSFVQQSDAEPTYLPDLLDE